MPCLCLPTTVRDRNAEPCLPHEWTIYGRGQEAASCLCLPSVPCPVGHKLLLNSLSLLLHFHVCGQEMKGRTGESAGLPVPSPAYSHVILSLYKQANLSPINTQGKSSPHPSLLSTLLLGWEENRDNQQPDILWIIPFTRQNSRQETLTLPFTFDVCWCVVW